jgi:hypothetical protein
MDKKKDTTKKGVADSQLSNLTRTKLIDELKRRGYSTKQLMNQDGLTGPEIEALATSGNGMNKGGSATSKKNMGSIAIIIGMGKNKKNMGGMLKKPEMMYGGMASKKKHMYSGGGSVTDKRKKG